MPLLSRPAGAPPQLGLTRAALAEQFQRDRFGLLGRALAAHGPVVELAPGTVLVNEAEAVHDVLRHTGTAYANTRNLFREPVVGTRGDSVHDRWMTNRRLATGEIPADLPEEHERWLRARAEELCDRWVQRSAGGVPIDPLPDLKELTSRSFARFSFGEAASRTIPDLEREMLDALMPVLESPFEPPLWLRTLLPRHRRMIRAHRALLAGLQDALRDRAPDTLADRLLRTGIEESSLVSLLLAMNNAGTGVPAAALVWALQALAAHPGSAEEIATGEEGAVGEFVDEVLRLWPPTWLIGRNTVEDTQCGRWRLPAGTGVMISPYFVHRSRSSFDRPEDFVPDRWKTSRPPRGAYIPFSSGPRWCVGGRFAVSELRTVVSVFGTRLRVRGPDTEPTPVPWRTLLPDPIEVRVDAR